MVNILESPTPLELRAELENLVIRDLLGPAGGPDEIVDEGTVRGRYIVGMLAPRGQSLLPDPPDEQGELALGGADGSEDSKSEEPIPQPDFAAMLPSSLGVTFSVSEQAKAIQITVRWGHYRRVKSE